MLSHAHNELLCRVGPNTPMGSFMRQFWLPCLPSSEFPVSDGVPKRMRLLGEDFVMFRDSSGQVGALIEACPHRGASLYFGRNEEGGLRCAYHGWKFDIHGNLLEVTTEREPVKRCALEAKLKARAFPCREVNHMVWIYMGDRSEPPPFPEFEINLLPPENVSEPSIMMEEANWLQNIEGDLDSAHLYWLHRRLEEDSPKPDVGMRGFWSPDREAPELDVVPTDYGAFYSAKRMFDPQTEWHRINQFLFPCFTMITTGDQSLGLRSFVPVDDHHMMMISQFGSNVGPIDPALNRYNRDPFRAVGGYVERTSDPRTYFLTKANRSNDYSRDMELQKSALYCGIPLVMNLQDRAMTELMVNDLGEPVYDRTQEHLGSSDAMVTTVRRQLLNAVKQFAADGSLPPCVDDPARFRVRPASINVPVGADWKEASREARTADPAKPVPTNVPLDGKGSFLTALMS